MHLTMCSISDFLKRSELEDLYGSDTDIGTPTKGMFNLLVIHRLAFCLYHSAPSTQTDHRLFMPLISWEHHSRPNQSQRRGTHMLQAGLVSSDERKQVKVTRISLPRPRLTQDPTFLILTPWAHKGPILLLQWTKTHLAKTW